MAISFGELVSKLNRETGSILRFLEKQIIYYATRIGDTAIGSQLECR